MGAEDLLFTTVFSMWHRIGLPWWNIAQEPGPHILVPTVLEVQMSYVILLLRKRGHPTFGSGAKCRATSLGFHGPVPNSESQVDPPFWFDAFLANDSCKTYLGYNFNKIGKESILFELDGHLTYFCLVTFNKRYYFVKITFRGNNIKLTFVFLDKMF